jgi:phosphatidylserine/phosphatidylglycerophosphate/cardiolipin synthase-like enzyme
MYIYDRKFLSEFLGRGGSSGSYVWTNKGLGQLSTEILGPHLLGEFRLNRLPAKAQQFFSKGGASWRDAVAEAIRAGIRNPNDLADLIFFMQYPTRMTAGVGKPIDKREPDFVKLRAEWNLYRTIATRLLKPAAAKPACTVFLPARTGNYEDYVAAPTTGRIALMINGRNSGGSGDIDDRTEAFDSMQETVESLGPNDSIFLATWQFRLTAVPLTVSKPGMNGWNWGDLLKSKAKDGVKIRIIISDHPPLASDFQTDLTPLDKIIGELPPSARDNLKYIHSKHPATLVVPIGSYRMNVPAGDHHQKFMVVKKEKTIIAFCGGLDISSGRTPFGWGPNFVWHDIHAKLEGLIARDLEREFVLRWNREKDKSTASKLPGWKGFETLVQAPVTSADREAGKNIHKLQMPRTVSVGTNPQDIRRDDIWQGYFRLIGCATRFIFMENQYFHEPKMADAIVKQAEAQPNLIVIIVVSSGTDDKPSEYTEHCRTVRNEFFARLFAGLPSNRRRVYTMFYPKGLVHSKLILVDDQALSMGSANANPRGFFLDTELNVMLDDAEAVKRFRHRLWSHDLGALPAKVAAWAVPDFIAQWDVVANFNAKKSPDQMVGEGVIPFDPRSVKGKRSTLIQNNVVC